MQWNLRALFVAIAVVAGACGALRAFWQDLLPNHDLLLGLYLLVLSGIVVTSTTRQARSRGGLIGGAIFGIAYFVFVLRGGFGIVSFSEAQVFVRHIYIGLALLPVAILWSQLCTMLLWPNKPAEQERQQP
jgi:hypothetical protein